MSPTIQMTTEEAAAKERRTSGDIMVDSGISSTSLRLSLHGSLTSSTRSTEGAAERDEGPAVKMPTSPMTKAAPNALEDSGVGICQDMNQLSIEEGESGTIHTNLVSNEQLKKKTVVFSDTVNSIASLGWCFGNWDLKFKFK